MGRHRATDYGAREPLAARLRDLGLAQPESDAAYSAMLLGGVLTRPIAPAGEFPVYREPSRDAFEERGRSENDTDSDNYDPARQGTFLALVLVRARWDARRERGTSAPRRPRRRDVTADSRTRGLSDRRAYLVL